MIYCKWGSRQKYGKEVSPMGNTEIEITEQATFCGCIRTPVGHHPSTFFRR